MNLKQLSQLLGLSQTTVSRALNGYPEVNAETRARVLAGVYIGFLVERLIRGEALEGREREVFVERVTAVFNTLIA